MPDFHWTYLLVYSPSIGPYESVREFIDSRPEIVYWIVCIPNTFLLVSSLSASDLTELFLKFTKKRGRFVILDTETDRNGWLPSPAWELMQNPAPPGKKKPG